MNPRTAASLTLLASFTLASVGLADGIQGYYRQPAIHGDTIVFVAEGDLWRVPVSGGRATRLTSHPGDEGTPAISPDGKTLAFTAQYEGPTEVYTMPLDGGLPTRRTFDSGRASVQGWTADGKVIGATERFSTLPSQQLYTLDLTSGERTLVPLAQAAEGSFEGDAGSTLYFTRLQFQGSNTKRYKGGTAQNLWKFAPGAKEAVALTPDFDGASKRPMWWSGQGGGRLYFLTDRDGTMNIWSMNGDGKDLKQHTEHKGFDAAGGTLDAGRIAYQLGADLHVYDIASDKDSVPPITLDSDFDQARERWTAKPMDYVTTAHISADGDRVVLTARGQVFVAPARQGRLVQATHDNGVRYRAARFIGEGQSLAALSDKSGEVELWQVPANGVGTPAQLTQDGEVLRWDVFPSPDGKLIASHDKNLRLWVYDAQKKTSVKVDESQIEDFSDMTWSADSQFLAYTTFAANNFKIVKIWSVQTGRATAVTTDRFDSYSPAFSADGKWLYLLSDRRLDTVVESPWGPNAPDPYLDKTTKIYQLALKPGQRSPFQPSDELFAARQKAEKAQKKQTEEKPPEKPGDVKPANGETYQPSKQSKGEDEPKKGGDKNEAKDEPKPPAKVEIDWTNIAARLFEVPVPAGNYGGLMVNEKALFYTSVPDRAEGDKRNLMALEIKNDPIEVKQVMAEVRSVELSADGKKLLVRKADTLYVLDAEPSPASDLDKKAVPLAGWMLSIIPRDEWRQMYTEAWRLERDYFYDVGMHGVNWKAMLEKYRPLVDRVASRADLSDILAQMIGELSALHMFVRGGDVRAGPDQVQVGFLGASLSRVAGGWRIERIYQSDPDDPHLTAPLARPGVDAAAGDVISSIDGVAAASDAAEMLRNRVGKQVLVRIKPGNGGEERDAIVVPIAAAAETDLRYHDWEYSRRKLVEEWSGGQIGYLHLRAMGGDNFTEFVRGFYPVFNRAGLIVDVRHNRGGNIDSWILTKLMRKAWFFWNAHAGNPPQWNMQYAFRGHMAALCDEFTASDGEAFSEGFKRLGLGKVIGTRTWGGEIWLSSSNILVDKGIATAAENGVYGPDGTWLIEGRGVEPDITVDNLPHATFGGEDAQLRAAVDHLLKLIKEKPVPPNTVPPRPVKAFDNK